MGSLLKQPEVSVTSVGGQVKAALLHVAQLVCLQICPPLWHTQLMETEPDCRKQELGVSSSNRVAFVAEHALACQVHCRVTPCWHCHCDFLGHRLCWRPLSVQVAAVPWERHQSYAACLQMTPESWHFLRSAEALLWSCKGMLF